MHIRLGRATDHHDHRPRGRQQSRVEGNAFAVRLDVLRGGHPKNSSSDSNALAAGKDRQRVAVWPDAEQDHVEAGQVALRRHIALELLRVALRDELAGSLAETASSTSYGWTFSAT